MDVNEGQSKKAKRSQSNPHICLVCGTRLARGAISYKERHWNQMHKDYAGNSQATAATMIVPESNEKAQVFLREKIKPVPVNQTETDKSSQEEDQLTDDEVPPPIAPLSPLEIPDNDAEPSCVSKEQTASNLPEHEEQMVFRQKDDELDALSAMGASKSTTVQSVLSNFIEQDPVEETTECTLMDLRHDLQKVLVKLDELSIGKTKTDDSHNNSQGSVETKDIENAKNLLELSVSPNVKVNALKDGCKIICIPCNEYIKDNPFMKR